MNSTLQTTQDKKLTLKQEKFCQLYATDAAFFGNATQAYIKAYGIDTSQLGQYDIAKRCAADNLAKPHLFRRINQLLEDIGFSDVEADKQLAFVMNQHVDFKAKMSAIKEYNSLKKRTQGTIINNGIALILEKYGLTDAGQAETTPPGLPKESP